MQALALKTLYNSVQPEKKEERKKGREGGKVEGGKKEKKEREKEEGRKKGKETQRSWLQRLPKLLQER